EARDAAPRRLDLARGELAVGGRLEAVLAEADLVRDVGQPLVAALVDLAVLGALGLQHDSVAHFAARRGARSSPSCFAARRGARSSAASALASWTAACRSKISPL